MAQPNSAPQPRAGKVVALYLRLSSPGQRRAPQESDLERWSDLNCWADGQPMEVRWYRCTWTGKSPRRPAWEQLMRDVDAGEIAAIVCWRLDRLGKSCRELVRLFNYLAVRRVNLISLKDQFDLSTPEGRRTANTLASVALFETELRAERIVAGQEAARARGIRWGGSAKGRRVKVTSEVEELVRRLRAEGHKVSHIAAETGLSRPTIYRVLGESKPEETS